MVGVYGFTVYVPSPLPAHAHHVHFTHSERAVRAFSGVLEGESPGGRWEHRHIQGAAACPPTALQAPWQRPLVPACVCAPACICTPALRHALGPVFSVSHAPLPLQTPRGLPHQQGMTRLAATTTRTLR